MKFLLSSLQTTWNSLEERLNHIYGELSDDDLIGLIEATVESSKVGMIGLGQFKQTFDHKHTY